MIFVNFKTYEQGTGEAALALVKIIEEVVSQTGLKIIPVVQASDIKEIASSTSSEVWSQKIDAFEFGAHTGAVLAEAVVQDGARGTFLNHSETRFKSFEELEAAHQRATSAGLQTLIFAADINELKQVLNFKPSFVAYEPPELIGSSDLSVAQAKPDVIREAALASTEFGIPLIVGAGVHSQEDVRVSLKLGAVGIAVASDIVKSDDPKTELLDLAAGFK